MKRHSLKVPLWKGDPYWQLFYVLGLTVEFSKFHFSLKLFKTCRKPLGKLSSQHKWHMGEYLKKQIFQHPVQRSAKKNSWLNSDMKSRLRSKTNRLQEEFKRVKLQEIEFCRSFEWPRILCLNYLLTDSPKPAWKKMHALKVTAISFGWCCYAETHWASLISSTQRKTEQVAHIICSIFCVLSDTRAEDEHLKEGMFLFCLMGNLAQNGRLLKKEEVWFMWLK